jgi:uncharacterized protein (TIGR03382 family)
VVGVGILATLVALFLLALLRRKKIEENRE